MIYQYNQSRVKTALITGVTGQDGSYLSELLLSKGYKVFGLIRRKAKHNFENLENCLDDIEIVEGDLLDQSSLYSIIERVNPDEIYNLAAQSFVPTSWTEPLFTSDVNAFGPVRILECIKQLNKRIRYYQASSSEMFGKVREMPQNEDTHFYPRSPYGVSKTYAHYITVNYRESYNIFACSGILFNHESPRRGLEFVTRKITDAVAKIKLGKQDKLYLGNLDAKRDWGYAKDYVEAMWLMLQQEKPDDFVIATGETHTVRDFVREASYVTGGSGDSYKDFTEVDQKFFRPAEVNVLLGDASKAKRILGWEPKTSFQELVHMMVNNDWSLEKAKGI